MKNNSQTDVSKLLETPLWSFDETREPDSCNPIKRLDDVKSKIFRGRVTNLLNAKNPLGHLGYRGTNIKYLAKILCKESQSSEVTESHFYANLFYFGDKAAYYYKENKQRAENSSNETLFDALNKQISISRQNSRAEIKSFCDNEHCFCDFFSNSINRRHFCAVLNSYQDAIRYYQAISHIFGKIEKNPSSGKSISLKLKTAMNFAEGAGTISEEETPIVLLYAFPKELENEKFSIKNFISSDRPIDKIETFLSQIGLPVYKTFCYNSQKEITVFGALMPHLIWGAYEFKKNRIIVNPAMFNKDSKAKATTSLWLSIDQQNFEKKIQDGSSYWNYVTYVPFEGMEDGARL